MAMEKANKAEMPIGQAPTPAPPARCAKKTMVVVNPQIDQESTWGLTVPRNIDQM